MIGGLVGAGLNATGLSTQGGFMGNAGGMVPGIGGLAGMALQQFGPLYEGQSRPYGPGGEGMPPTPMASMFGGPQMGQAGGLLGNANFFSDPMTIKRVS
jgi:hypothetical protein